ncbi:MAG: peptide deformylase [Gammaproteobacteria bacterium 28-57-27]|nr:MAG: peptide deformylase [Gammaproteobacteria bacterium 28-57-27]
MACLPILLYPHPNLRKVAQRVDVFDENLRRLVTDMFATMYDAPGIGLAATQVDVHQKLAVIDVSEEKNQPLVLVNAEILASEGIEEMEEGCLSIPGINEKVTRKDWVRVRYQDLDGKECTLETGGLLAVCIQHELDHLNGRLFIDHISPLKRERALKKYDKLQKRERE